MKKILLFLIITLFSCMFAYSDTENSKNSTGNIYDKQLQTTTEYWQTYLRKLEHTIKKDWDPPKDIVSKSTTVLFKVDKNGNISDIKTLKSSGNNEFDNNAIDTIKKKSPVEPLPKEFNGENVDVEFTFDYNVMGHKSYSGIYSNYTNGNNPYYNHCKTKFCKFIYKY